MKITLLGIIYVAECIRYRVGNYVLFQNEMNHIKNRVFIVGMAISVIISLFCPVNDNGKLVIIAGISAVVTLWGMEGTMTVKTTQLIWNTLMLTCMDGISGSIIKFRVIRDETIQGYLEYLLCDCITLLIMTVLFVFVKHKRGSSLGWIDKVTRNSVYIGLGITAIGMIFSVAGLNYAKKYISNERFLSVVDEICSITYIGMCILIYFVIYIRNANHRIQNLLEVEQTLRKTQINNYQILLKKEEDTRRFRHDIHNHVICLRELLKKGKKEDAENYLNQVYEKLKAIQEECYVTGSDVLDAVLNYYLGELDSRVEVEVTGVCTGTIDASEFSLCTIFGNLMQNAVEELEKHTVSGGHVSVHINTGRKYVEVFFCNSTYRAEKQSDSEETVQTGIKTAKNDKRNHGFGLKNVEETLKCCGGDFEYKEEGGEFKARVVLPVK